MPRFKIGDKVTIMGRRVGNCHVPDLEGKVQEVVLSKVRQPLAIYKVRVDIDETYGNTVSAYEDELRSWSGLDTMLELVGNDLR
jgi:hypothetical protein